MVPLMTMGPDAERSSVPDSGPPPVTYTVTPAGMLMDV
jgi:hypothetical protein